MFSGFQVLSLWYYWFSY